MKKMLFISVVFFVNFAQTSRATDLSYFDLCNNTKAQNTTIPFDEEGRFRPECAPDTLYSWQPRTEIDFSKFSSDVTYGKNYLYTWRTPLGTFGYGDVQIRIKLKPRVKFLWVAVAARLCDLHPHYEWRDTVFVSVYPFGGSDYLICSPEVAESWSVRTPESKLEATNELSFIQTHKNRNVLTYDAYGFQAGRKFARFGSYENPYFMTVDTNAKYWSHRKLKANLASMDRVESEVEGKIYYGAEVEPNRKRHFSSSSNAYFKLSSDQLDGMSVGVGALMSQAIKTQ